MRLHEHTDILRKERDGARQLMELLRKARQYALPDDVWLYDRMIRKAEMLERYFSGMTDQVDNMSIELARLSVKINMMLRDTGGALKVP